MKGNGTGKGKVKSGEGKWKGVKGVGVKGKRVEKVGKDAARGKGAKGG